VTLKQVTAPHKEGSLDACSAPHRDGSEYARQDNNDVKLHNNKAYIIRGTDEH